MEGPEPKQRVRVSMVLFPEEGEYDIDNATGLTSDAFDKYEEQLTELGYGHVEFTREGDT